MMKKSSKAFTLLELIFVIVILALVGMMSFSQIALVYESLIQKEATVELENEAKVILEQIAARLNGGIKESFVGLTQLNPSDDTIHNGHCMPISMLDPQGVAYDRNYKILAWIGIDTEGHRGLWNGSNYYTPSWSGFADLAGSDYTKIVTPGSKLDDADTIIKDLSTAGATLGVVVNKNPAVYFVGSANQNRACDGFDFIGKTQPSVDGLDYNYTYPVSGNTGTTLTFSDRKPTQITEHYMLSWSAYAIVHDSVANQLNLYYDFRPWNGELPVNGTSTILGKNVLGFGFKYESGLIRINVCVGRQVGPDRNASIEVCKEKAIF